MQAFVETIAQFESQTGFELEGAGWGEHLQGLVTG
jgi:hypothetical protein